jgi:parallel beta helix pectate lyase-like protein
VVMTGGGTGGSGTGLMLYDSEAEIRNADFSGNRVGISAERTSLTLAGATLAGNERQALTAENCRLNIAGNSFTANGSGVSLTGCEGSVSANRIAKNGDYGLALANSRVKVNGNEIESNDRVGLRVEDGKGIAWGNVLFANGDYELYNAGIEDFRAFGNWWGRAAPANVAGRIYGRVLYFPVLRARPAPVLP